MSENKNPRFLQGADNLRAAADMASADVGVCASPVVPARDQQGTSAKAMEAKFMRTPPSHTCRTRLKLTFYFDGTGNNLDADQPTYEHSNVAKVYLAREFNSAEKATYSFYIPGLGTYFSEINDLGDSQGKAFGRRGEQRLQWALQKFQERRAATQNLVGIDVAIIGFSRGAALARAFANRIQQLCNPGPGGTGWALKGTSIAVDIYFLGLWDTVASVGLPKSVNNQTLLGLLQSGIYQDAEPPSQHMLGRDVGAIAYGQPGADPAGSFLWSWGEGHRDWGAEMGIPAIVSGGLHLMAGHETRNSFPVDTVMQGAHRAGVFEGREFVYPGAHSDVGGGYRPGEGGRSWNKGQQLSLITLRVMFDAARSAGVPLRNLYEASYSRIRRLDFAMALPNDPEENHAAAREYAELVRVWNRYLDHCGRSSRPIGQWFLVHMKAYYAWRFRTIRKNRSARASHRPTDDERSVQPLEAQAKQEQAALDKRIAAEEQSSAVQQSRAESSRARERLQAAQGRLAHTQQSGVGWLMPLTPDQAQQLLTQRREVEKGLMANVAAAERDVAGAEQAQAGAEDPLHRLQAQRATLPSQGTLARNWREYEDRLYDDAQSLSHNRLFRRSLRPHYRALVEAWEDEFLHDRGLADVDVIRFFDVYVHDSLADFGLDATLPSDPRVVYVGGDEIALFAGLQPARSDEAVTAG